MKEWDNSVMDLHVAAAQGRHDETKPQPVRMFMLQAPDGTLQSYAGTTEYDVWDTISALGHGSCGHWLRRGYKPVPVEVRVLEEGE